MRKEIWIVLVIGVAVAIGGCASGSDRSSVASATVSKSKFMKQMESLCERSEKKKFEEIGTAAHEGMWPKNGEPTQEDLEEITSAVVVPVFNHMTQEMREMPLPIGREEKVEAMIEAFEADVRKMEKDPNRFIEGIAFKEGNTAAAVLGLSQCSF